MNMSRYVLLLVGGMVLSGAGSAAAQEGLSKEQWQQQINQYTEKRIDLDAKVKALTSQVDALKAQSKGLDEDLKKCTDELYALVGSDAEKAAAYRGDIDAAESKANELARLSDADLMARSGKVKDLSAQVKSLWDNKLSLIPEFYDRLTALNEKVKSLEKTIEGRVKMYSVGTWRRDRDCLWNISRKKDVYDNPWWWPKIWQDNRDQIKDPDLIYPGEKLKIPPAGDLTAEEKSAADTYYASKAHSSGKTAHMAAK